MLLSLRACCCKINQHFLALIPLLFDQTSSLFLVKTTCSSCSEHVLIMFSTALPSFSLRRCSWERHAMTALRVGRSPRDAQWMNTLYNIHILFEFWRYVGNRSLANMPYGTLLWRNDNSGSNEQSATHCRPYGPTARRCGSTLRCSGQIELSIQMGSPPWAVQAGEKWRWV